MSDDAKAPLHSLVVVGGQALALLAVAMPAVGVGVRLVGFWLRGVQNPTALAAAASLQELATLGVASSLPGILMILLYLPAMRSTGFTLFVRREHRASGGVMTEERRQELLARRPRPAPFQRPWSPRSRKLIIASSSTMVAVALVFFPGFPALVVVGALALASIVVGVRLIVRTGETSLGTVWPALLILLAASVAYGAIALVSIASADYQFSSTSAVDGEYVLLGQKDGQSHLRSCAPDHLQISVRTEDIELVTYFGHPDSQLPSLWEIITDGDASITDAGIRLVCRQG